MPNNWHFYHCFFFCINLPTIRFTRNGLIWFDCDFNALLNVNEPRALWIRLDVIPLMTYNWLHNTADFQNKNERRLSTIVRILLTLPRMCVTLSANMCCVHTRIRCTLTRLKIYYTLHMYSFENHARRQCLFLLCREIWSKIPRFIRTKQFRHIT